MKTDITVFYDYLCPFAFRAVTLLESIKNHVDGGLVIDYKAFSIEQQNRKDGDVSLWEEPNRPGIGFYALVAAKAAANQGNDFRFQ